MMDKKHNEPQDDSYYDALIKQRIGEALRNQSRKERLDLAQLEAWVEADRQRRRAKVKRILAVASCFIILCIGTFSLKFVFDPDDSIATAGKNDNKVTEEGNNVVVKPNGDGVDENTGGEKIVINKWEGVAEIREQYSDLLIPSYMPSDYSFENLTVEKNGIIQRYIFVFKNKTDNIIFKQTMNSDLTVVYDFDRKIQCNKYKLLIDERKEKIGYCALENGYISIIADIPDNEMKDIVNGIE
ncbi:Uncharacterised protein [uncultured Eubacterium sp.]|nr:Uncharacterised protein [uncultured Eubacterium sp.]